MVPRVRDAVTPLEGNKNTDFLGDRGRNKEGGEGEDGEKGLGRAK